MTPVWIDFPTRGDARGLLNIAECGARVPFVIRRVYWIHSTAPGVARGFHAHHALDQILVAVAGSCRVWLDDGTERIAVRLDGRDRGLAVGPMVWHEMDEFSPDCVLMALASAPYDEADYIRDYTAFCQAAHQGRPNSFPAGLERVELRRVEQADAAWLCALRQDAVHRGVLSAGAADTAEQEAWLREYEVRHRHGLDHYFVIRLDGRDVGAVRIYDINFGSRTFTWGSWIMSPATPAVAAVATPILIYDYAFYFLNLNEAQMEVVAHNLSVVRFHRNFGAREEPKTETKHHFRLNKAEYDTIRAAHIHKYRLPIRAPRTGAPN